MIKLLLSMPNKELIDIISSLSSFMGFTQDEAAILASHSELSEFEAGETLLFEGKECKNFYFIISGSISLQVFSEERGTLEIDTVNPDEFLGWTWLSLPCQNNFDAIAFENTKALTFDSRSLKQEMEANHEFGYKMYNLFTPIIIKRLQASSNNIVGLYEKSF